MKILKDNGAVVLSIWKDTPWGIEYVVHYKDLEGNTYLGYYTMDLNEALRVYEKRIQSEKDRHNMFND